MKPYFDHKTTTEPVQQLRSSSRTSSISAVRVMSWSVNWPQATNRKVRAWSWKPSSR